MPLHYSAWSDFMWQSWFCSEYGGKILNACSSNDPKGLAHLFDDVTNMDLYEVDPSWKFEDQKTASKPINFLRGSVLDIPSEPAIYDTVLLGEWLEHATYASAVDALKECARVTKQEGAIGISLPFDYEGIEYVQNHPEDAHAQEATNGVTVGHSHMWTTRELDKAIAEAGLFVVEVRFLAYDFSTVLCGGLGVVMGKRGSPKWQPLQASIPEGSSGIFRLVRERKPIARQ